ncbi:MAG: hypothetical protein R6T99_04155 [Bacteroidales bacterium]
MKTHHIIVFLSLSLTLLVAGCEKETDKKVVYRISDNASGYSVNYRGPEGALHASAVSVASGEDVWTYAFMAGEGDIVFVSAIYKDITGEIKVEILIDGKVYKQGYSKYDTVKYVTVSGVVPYE